VRRSLYKTVTETGLDRLDTRTSSCPEYLYNIKSLVACCRQERGRHWYVLRQPIKWNQKDVVSFICHEVTMGDVKEFRICR
jgi:hypothetical protein